MKQFGCRKSKSTSDALQDVLHSFQPSHNTNANSIRVILLATLDVGNAFNSRRWVEIIKEFKFNHIKFAENYKILKWREKKFGAAQGLIVEPELCYIAYFEIL